MKDYEKTIELAKCAEEKLNELDTFVGDMRDAFKNIEDSLEGLKKCFPIKDEVILGKFEDGRNFVKPKTGTLVTHAFVSCCVCNKTISTCNGPRTDVYCLDCWDEIERYEEG